MTVDLHLVTPEAAPLELFGARRLSRELRGPPRPARGITLARRARLDAGDARRPARGHAAALGGPAIAGLPSDAQGFLVTDEYGRVRRPGVYAAGDVTDFEVKQGGIACQQADAAAAHIAARAGAPVAPEPFVPELKGLLLTEHWARYLQPGAGAATSRGTRGLSWPPAKIAGRELAGYLKTLEPAHA